MATPWDGARRASQRLTAHQLALFMSLIPTGAQLNGPVAATSALYGLYRLASSTVNLLIRLASGQWENAATSPRRWRVLRPPHDVSFVRRCTHTQTRTKTLQSSCCITLEKQYRLCFLRAIAMEVSCICMQAPGDYFSSIREYYGLTVQPRQPYLVGCTLFRYYYRNLGGQSIVGIIECPSPATL